MTSSWRWVAVAGAAAIVGCGPAASTDSVAAGLQTALAAVTDPFAAAPESAAAGWQGQWAGGDHWLEIFGAEGSLYGRTEGVARGPLKRQGDELLLARPDGGFETLQILAGDEVGWGGDVLHRVHLDRPPPPISDGWRGLIGGYRRVGDTGGPAMLVLERSGRLYLQAGDRLLYRIETQGPDLVLGHRSWAPGVPLWFERDSSGGAIRLRIGDLELLPFPPMATSATSFRIVPQLEIGRLRAAALQAEPPRQSESLRPPELVNLQRIDGIRLDIRYATTNNFMGSVFYEQARAFMQRPAAAALARVQATLAARGYGLLIHDAYRPWYVTKMFWDATPESQRIFVADPASGSRHNRGCAVDLTLYELDSGDPVSMTGGYDEFSQRSYPDFGGGTSRQRWHRELLRASMRAEGFSVYDYEWWHFDFRDWSLYPVLNLRFDEIGQDPGW